jgi:addiction module HigA family antidote
MDDNTPIHPGEHLAEILAELDISQYRLATTIGVSPRRINEIVHGNRAISADSALRIGKALRMTPESWMNLQKMYELEKARNSTDVSQIEPLVPEPAEIPVSDSNN